MPTQEELQKVFEDRRKKQEEEWERQRKEREQRANVASVNPGQ
jgi:hypothetical protein